MSKKPSGLGRGLDELLTDNSPSARNAGNTTVIIKAPEASDTQFTKSDIYGTGTKKLYDTGHRNRSVKANFKK